MRWYKIFALVYMDMLIFRNVKFRLLELFYFPITTVVIWGLFSTFVKDMALEAGLMVLAINVFWSFAYLAQSTVNMQMNEDVWSGNLRNIFSSGITEFEYLIARIISATIVSLAVVAIMLSISYYFFGLVLIAEEFGFVMFFIGMILIASIALSIFVAASIVNFGIEYAFLAWSIIQIFILLSAPFYPVSIFPEPVQLVSYAMPYTFSFEGVRYLINTGTVADSMMLNGFMVALAYLLVSIPVYAYTFRHSRKKGTLAKLSSS